MASSESRSAMTELAIEDSPHRVQTERPLCVDMDGTLVKSDTLIDSLIILARRDPAACLYTPWWASKGKSYLKAQVASRVMPDPAHLPYNRPLLDYLRDERAAGRKVYLVTGAHSGLAQSVATHLGIFAGVMASDDSLNLTGKNKLAHLQQQFATEGFDYVGNSFVDLPLLQVAHEAMIANPDFTLKAAIRSHKIPISRQFLDRSSLWMALVRALRIHQWAKNLLVILPVLLAHTFRLAPLWVATVAFFSFSLIASATYILNDLLDLESDRIHLTKRRRAFAAGDLSVTAGLAVSGVLVAFSLGLAAQLPRRFLVYLLFYLVTTLAYSLKLKRIVLVDVIVLSGLYTVRMVAGAAATYTVISPWLAAFSIFFFLSLAMVKRFSELEHLIARGLNPSNARGYLLSDLEQLRSFGTSSAYASVVIFALYINGRDVVQLYHHPSRMWLITPLFILWVSRVWLLASRGLLHEDPVVFALTDRMSILLGLGVVLIAWAAL